MRGHMRAILKAFATIILMLMHTNGPITGAMIIKTRGQRATRLTSG